MDQKLFFKLEEEGNVTLLLHLLKLNTESTDFGSAVGLGCFLVVAAARAVTSCICDWFSCR